MKVGIVGCGVMGRAFARVMKAYHQLYLLTRNPEKIKDLDKEKGIEITTSFEEIGQSCEAVILAVKPQDFQEVAEDLDPVMDKGSCLLSILGGTPLSVLQTNFSNPKSFRLMPNLPLICGKGLIGVVGDEEDKKRIHQILKGLGDIIWMDEKYIDPFAALTGSGPGFIYLMMEAMVQAGITIGFKAEEAREYVLKTIEGSTSLLRHTGLSLSEARQAICSPEGTTIAGLNEMEKNRVRYGIISGILKALE